MLHALHNCAMKIRNQFIATHNAISTIKAITIKSNRSNDFSSIGAPPQPILTRWGTWLKAANYYSNNLPQVRQIVKNFSGSGVLVTRARQELENSYVTDELVKISMYKPIMGILKNTEDSIFTIESAFHSANNISFGDDPFSIKEYIDKRVKQTDLINLIGNEPRNIFPSELYQLHQCPSTSVSAERSFSILKKILRMNRQFSPENVRMYAMLNFNSFMDS